MNTPTVLHLDRLELDLRGIPPEVARAAVASLGPAVTRALEDYRSRRGGVAPAGAVRLAGEPTVDAVRAAIANQVAAALAPALDRARSPGPSADRPVPPPRPHQATGP